MDTLFWYAEITLDYIFQMLPCVFCAAAVFFLLLPVRRRRLARLGLRSGPLREGALLLFLLFCAGLAALTLFPANFWTSGHWSAVLQGWEPLFKAVDWHIQFHTIQLVPLREISGAFRSPWRFFMLLGNIVMFLPLGFCSTLLWQNESWQRALLVGLGGSALVEAVQFFIGRGSDVDDLILNALGALCGYWLFCLLRRLLTGFPQKFRCVKVDPLYG